jgi:hypothetical protein
MSQPEYANYTQMDVKDHVLSGSLTIVTLFKEVSGLIPHAGPLSQALGLTKELIGVINQIRDNKDSCEFLVERILRFMKKLIEECSRINEPIRDGTPMALRLYDLISWVEFPEFSTFVSYRCSRHIQAIKDDAEAWKAESLRHRFWYRGPIKTAVSNHQKNLDDCFHSFTVSHVYVQLLIEIIFPDCFPTS